MVVSYGALALQTRCRAINGLGAEDARVRIASNASRIAGQVIAAKALFGPNLALVVLPEYILTGFPISESFAQWRQMATLRLDGPEIGTLAECAVEAQVHLAVNAYVLDDAFPGLYFQCSFVIDPGGSVVLRYHRLISMFAPSPFDVLTRYLDHYGADALFPVADTPIGRLAAIASEEILYPEIARLAAMQGAEVLLHTSGEMASPVATAKSICRRARAVENMAIVVSANAASLEAGDIASSTTDGGSEILDHRGTILARAGQGESLVAYAEIDIAALRRARTTPGMGAMLARIPAEAVGDMYRRLTSQPSDTLLAVDGTIIVPERQWFAERQRHAIAQLKTVGRLPTIIKAQECL